MELSFLKNTDISHVEKALLGPDGRIRLLPARAYGQFTQTELSLFCHKHARYGLPTIELVQELWRMIGGRTAIEIGSGYGDLGYHLSIPMTDSKVMERPEVAAFYRTTGQPVIDYPDDVEYLEALEAVKEYRPQVVVASWVTAWIDPTKPPPPGGGSVYGVREDKLLEQVETYILIGNIAVHGHKPIMDRDHTTYHYPFLKSRATRPELDRIFVWGKHKGLP